MATTKTPPDTDQPAGPPAVATPATPPARASKPPEAPLWTTAIYYGRPGRGRRGKGKRRPRYSKGTRAWQRLTFGSGRAGYRIANSFARGLRTFVRRSDRSRKRRKDGMLRDQFRNASRGFSTALRELGRAPNEIARRISGRNARDIALAFNPGNPFRFFGR